MALWGRAVTVNTRQGEQPLEGAPSPAFPHAGLLSGRLLSAKCDHGLMTFPICEERRLQSASILGAGSVEEAGVSRKVAS